MWDDLVCEGGAWFLLLVFLKKDFETLTLFRHAYVNSRHTYSIHNILITDLQYYS
jgi:hypothetical protein